MEDVPGLGVLCVCDHILSSQRGDQVGTAIIPVLQTAQPGCQEVNRLPQLVSNEPGFEPGQSGSQAMPLTTGLPCFVLEC